MGMWIKWCLGGNKAKKVKETKKLLTRSKKLTIGRCSAHRLQQFCAYFKNNFLSKPARALLPAYLLAGQLFVRREAFPAQDGADGMLSALTYICQYSNIIFINALFQQVLAVGILF